MPMRKRISVGSTSVIVNIDALVLDAAGDVRVGDQFVHAVEATQHGALTASGRPDKRHDGISGNLDRHIFHGESGAVADAHVFGFKNQVLIVERDDRVNHEGKW